MLHFLSSLVMTMQIPSGRKSVLDAYGDIICTCHCPSSCALFSLELNCIDPAFYLFVQIPSGRKSALDAYGDIIFRAWKDSVGSATQFEIENSCILVGPVECC